jgi:phospholipase/carboxylesterase
MHLAIEWLPAQQPAPQLMILLHGYGGRGAAMEPLAHTLRAAFPLAALLAPDAPHPVDAGGDGRQWFSATGLDETQRVHRVQAALPGLRDWVRSTQARLGVSAPATALVGFSQGAIMALELAQFEDGIAGRVLAFAGRFASLPARAPQLTTFHLLHGGADTVMPATHAREALEHLGARGGDATLDIAQGIGHEIHPALVDSALHRLRTHIPQRTWREALGAASGAAGRPDLGEDD